MRLNFRRQFVISFAIVLTGVLVSATIFYFLVGNIDATVSKIMSDKLLSNQQSGALAVVAAMKKQAPQAAVYQAAMDKLLPSQDGLIGFGKWVTDNANSNQVGATVSYQGAGGFGQNLGQMAFTLSATGNLNALVAFLNDIEVKSPGYLVQFGSFTLSSANNTGGYQLSSQGRVFFKQ